MRNFVFKVINTVLVAVFLISSILSVSPVKIASAETTISDRRIEIVDNIENVQIPKTTTVFVTKESTNTQYFSISGPTAVKVYFSWDTDFVTRMTVWISTDYSGMNIIGNKQYLTSPGQSFITMLDAGTYYLCYDASFTSKTDYAFANYAIIGERITTTETVPQSSKSKPNELRLSTSTNRNINYGFLSVTAPIDYYIFSVDTSSEVTFEFNFKEYNGISLNNAVIKVFNYETEAMLGSQKFNYTMPSANNLKINLEKGIYYVTLSGATTATTLSVTIKPIQNEQKDDSSEAIRDKATPIHVTYVDYIDNYQYPETDKFTTVSGIIGVKSFTLTKPTIIKVYMTWDTTAFRSATIWLSQDESGYDIIEAEKTLSKTTSYLFHLLDPGTYYINYKMTGTSNSAKSKTGICLLGQKVSTNEGTNYASSYENPITLTQNKTYKGFLSVTAPVDYYKLTLDEKSMVTFTYDFAQLNGNSNSNATIRIFNKNNVLLKKQGYASDGADRNKLQMLLDKGTYYISMTGAETTTILKASTEPRTISAKKTIVKNKKVKISLSFAFNPAEIKVIKGYVYDEFINDSITWSKATTLNGKSYTVSETGYYTFRVKDVYGNYFLKRVNVTSIK